MHKDKLLKKKSPTFQPGFFLWFHSSTDKIKHFQLLLFQVCNLKVWGYRILNPFSGTLEIASTGGSVKYYQFITIGQSTRNNHAFSRRTVNKIQVPSRDKSGKITACRLIKLSDFCSKKIMSKKTTHSVSLKFCRFVSGFKNNPGTPSLFHY